jgi:hypothetical protein
MNAGDQAGPRTAASRFEVACPEADKASHTQFRELGRIDCNILDTHERANVIEQLVTALNV